MQRLTDPQKISPQTLYMKLRLSIQTLTLVRGSRHGQG